MELAAAERHQIIERLLAGDVPCLRVDDLAVHDKNGSLHVRGGNFQHGRTARQAFHLQHVLQPDPPQHALETFLRLQLDQFVERRIKILPTLPAGGLLQEKFSPVAQTRGAIRLGGVTGQRHFQNLGILAMQQREELQTIHHRHVKVDDEQVDFLFANQR